MALSRVPACRMGESGSFVLFLFFLFRLSSHIGATSQVTRFVARPSPAAARPLSLPFFHRYFHGHLTSLQAQLQSPGQEDGYGYANSTQAFGCFIRRSETPAPAWPSSHLALGWSGLLMAFSRLYSEISMGGTLGHWPVSRLITTSPSKVRSRVHYGQTFCFVGLADISRLIYGPPNVSCPSHDRAQSACAL